MINNGSVLSDIPDEKSRLNLGTKNTQLYINSMNQDLFYFFSTYTYEKEEDKENLHEIETEALNIEAYAGTNIKPIPQRSYLILFYQIPSDVDFENVYRNIIDLEENEYIFKKYVFYYKIEEYEAFMKWYSDTGNCLSYNELLKIIATDTDFSKLEYRFLLRLMIKLPYLNFDFKQLELFEFDTIVVDKISAKRGAVQKEGLFKYNAIIQKKFNESFHFDDAIEFAEELIEDIVGDIHGQLQDIKNKYI